MENLNKALSLDPQNNKLKIKIAEGYLMYPKDDEENYEKYIDYAVKFLLEVL